MATDPEDPRSTSFGHRPGLDGVRGIAVLVVVAFHSGVQQASGGFLGVSTFFTLSGFLITTLALFEYDGAQRIDLRAFWLRRIRRLLPAQFVLVLGVVVGVAVVGIAAGTSDIGRQVIATLTYTANWQQVFGGHTYAEIFSTPSPLAHVWSLSIEEQFYLIFPLVAAVVLPLRRWALGVVALIVAVASFSLPVLLSLNFDRAYYGTDSRAGEIAIGVLAAVLLYRPLASKPSPVLRAASSAAGVIGLVVMVGSWFTVERNATLWHGTIVLYAFASVGVVVAASLGAGITAKIFSTPVLRRFGFISYGLYLYHWPVLWLLNQYTHLNEFVLFALDLAISYVLASASLRWIETPIRRNGFAQYVRNVPGLRRVPSAVVAISAVFVLIGAASVVSVTRHEPSTFDRAQAALESEPITPIVGAIPVAFFGDSTAAMTGSGFKTAVESIDSGQQSQFRTVAGSTKMGCGILDGMRHRSGDWEAAPEDVCVNWQTRWQQAIDSADPKLAVVETGAWETWEVRLPGRTDWLHLGDPEFDAFAMDTLRAATATLTSRGATVVFLTPPTSRPERANDPAPFLPGPCRCADRFERLRDLELALAAEDPAHVKVVDLAQWQQAQGADDVRLRPDGVHVTDSTGVEVAQRFLIPELQRIIASLT